MADSVLTVLCVSAAITIAVVLLCKKRVDNFHVGIDPRTLYKLETDAKPSVTMSRATSSQILPGYTPGVSAYYSEGLLRSDNTKYFGVMATDNDLPIACVSTLGGDIMMCPESGVCPLNGERCQPRTRAKPCCNDNYPPKETWYWPNRPPVADYMYMS